ncbi:MAG: rhodanese-like domain-containing protein [Pyrinomonadaceae bacterium]|nr:rhodanese-like domain-containing protein [Pyrinomonadaceae bacterium]
MRFILSTVVALAFGLSILTACQDAAAPVKVETAKTTNTNSVAVTPKADEHGEADDAPRITLAEAKKDFDAGNTIFVDTRAEAAYKQEHIKGAINVPMESFEAKYKDIPTGKKIIAYCS